MPNEIVIHIKGDTANFDHAAQRTGGVLQSLGTIAAGVGLGSIGVSFVSGIKDAVGALIGFSSQMEQNSVAFEVLTGNAKLGKETLAELVEFARTSPLETGTVVEMGRRLLAMNFEAKDLTGTMKMLGDIASGVGTEKLPQLVLALGQVKSAGRLTGMELRQFTESGVGLLAPLAEAYGKTTAEIIEMVSEGKIGYESVRYVLEQLTDEGGRFNDMTERQAQTFGGAMAAIKDSALITLSDGLSPLFDRLRDGAVDLANSSGDWSQWAANIKTFVTDALASVDWFAANVVPKLQAIGNVLRGGIPGGGNSGRGAMGGWVGGGFWDNIGQALKGGMVPISGGQSLLGQIPDLNLDSLIGPIQPEIEDFDELAAGVLKFADAANTAVVAVKPLPPLLEGTAKKAKEAKTALQELGVSANTMRKAMEMAEFSIDEQRYVLEALGVAAIDAGPLLDGLSLTADRLALAFLRAGLSIDATNDAIGRIQASIAKKESDRLAEIAQREAEKAEAERKRAEEEAKDAAEELERRTLDIGELMKGAYAPKGFDKFVASVMGSADIITDEAKATLDDWRRQYFEFNRDIALLFEELDKAGTQGSAEVVAKIKGIIAGFEALPDELQGPLSEIKNNLKKMLEDFKLTSDGAVDLVSRNHAQMVLIEQERIDELKRVQKQEFDSKTEAMLKETELSQRLAAAQDQETITKRKLLAEVNHSVMALGAEQELRKRALMESRKAEREARGGAQRGILQQVLGVLGFGGGAINPGMENTLLAGLQQSGLAGANESQGRILDLLEALLSGSLKVEMDGAIVGRIVGHKQQERGRLLAAMGGG